MIRRPHPVLHTALAAVLLATVAACKSEAKKDPAPSPATAAPSTNEAPTAQGSASAMPSYPGRAVSIGDKMAQEATARPAGALRAEEVLAAFQKDGMKLKEPPKQHLGSPVGAMYCVGARSEANVAMSVCEYRDEAAAKKGRDESLAAFKAIENRDVHVNKQTTLTVLQNPKGPESEAESTRIVAQFAKM
jgi:hypothetical protein